MLRNLRKKFGEIMKMVFGRNSATRRIMVVEIKVFTISIRRSEPRNGESRFPRILENTRPYITRAKLFPISIVAMYWPGLSVKSLIIFDPNTPCFLSSSILSRFEVTNAISIPEKNAERIIARNIIRITFIPQS
jgi:hypothetical protein